MPKLLPHCREVVAGLICSPLYFALRPSLRLALVKNLAHELKRLAS